MEDIDYFLIGYAGLFLFSIIYALWLSHKQAKKNNSKIKKS